MAPGEPARKPPGLAAVGLAAGMISAALGGRARAERRVDDLRDAPVVDGRPSAASEIGDQSVGGALGLAVGGRDTAGGLRIAGHYLYQLSDTDWFDGGAVFTLGGGDAACFRDRDDQLVCDHGIADGAAAELAIGVRRMFAAQGAFRPFARAALGVGYVRFSDDDLGGLVVPLHVGGGVRARVAPGVAVVGMGELTAGLGLFGRGLGGEPQLGLAVTAGAEFRLP